MRLIKAGEYAIRCLLYLSAQEEGVVTPRNEIADAMDIPREFLAKIAQQLSRGDIIETIQSPKGGFCLRVPLSVLRNRFEVQRLRLKLKSNDKS